MRDQIDIEDMGGTLRLGLYPCKLKAGSRAAAAYNNQEVVELCQRHRYEFNKNSVSNLRLLDLSFQGYHRIIV